jgi:CRISPR/Cas system-associated exonuclease Cas4 (RecB family)
MKEKLDAKLAIFKNALTTGQFPVAESSDTCSYCTLAGICGRYNEEKEEAE